MTWRSKTAQWSQILRQRARGRMHWLIAGVAALVWLGLVSLPQQAPPAPEMVGAAPTAWTAPITSNEPTVQVRVVLGHFLPSTVEAQGHRVLAQPSATTLLGTATVIEQTVRLGALAEVDVSVRATPRPALGAKAVDGSATLTMDEEIEVIERRRTLWGLAQESAPLLKSQVVHYDAVRRLHRIEFAASGQRFFVEISALAQPSSPST